MAGNAVDPTEFEPRETVPDPCEIEDCLAPVCEALHGREECITFLASGPPIPTPIPAPETIPVPLPSALPLLLVAVLILTLWRRKMECQCRSCAEKRDALREKNGESLTLEVCGRMIVCPDCGNKRCPKATFHGNDCTNSNEPGQPGSVYAAHDPTR